MKKVKSVLLAMLAVSALGMVLVTTASAAESTLEAFWLINGNKAVTQVATTTSGQILLEDNNTIAGAAAVLCSGILEGTIEPGGLGTVTKVLNLLEEEIGVLGGLALLGTGGGPDCVTEKVCAEGTAASPIEVFPLGLPWKTLLYLMQNNTILLEVDFGKYELLCLVLGINTEDTCTAVSGNGLEVLNDPETGDAESPGGAIDEPLATCTMGGANSGVNQLDELAFITSIPPGNLITVSSE